MQWLRVANTGLRASRIAFGTAAIHHLRRAPQQQRLLLAAADSGISHFDTSPYYGFGIAERALAVLAPRCATTTVATKVGLYPAGGADAPAVAVFCRKVAGRVVPGLSRAIVDFHVARARDSLSGSLRRMRRERVDVLFLHEPRRELVQTDEWLRWAEAEKDRVGALGVAGEAERLLPFIKASSPLATIVQTRDSLARQEAAPLRAAGCRPHITYGHLAQREAAARVAETLTRTIAHWPDTIFLISTRRAERIRDLARIALTSESRMPVSAHP
jgi:D-threo-aldose 1-dehydrogenase